MKIRLISMDGIKDALADPHPTIPRCMRLRKWAAEVHAPTLCLPVQGANGTTAYRAEFSTNDEVNHPERIAKTVADWNRLTSPEALRQVLERVKSGNVYCASALVHLCLFVGLQKEVDETLAVVRERNRRQEEQREEEGKARDEKARRDDEAMMAKAEAGFIAGKTINTMAFERLCSEHGITMHMRTIGTLRKRIVELSTDSIRGDLRGAGTTGIFQAIRALKEALTTPKEPNDPALDHLFGRERVLVEIPIPKGP